MLFRSRGAQRAISLFKRLGYPSQKVHLIVNRWAKKTSLPLERVEEFLGASIACQISNDYLQVIDSINQGQPISKAATDSALALDLRRLATILGAPIKAAAAKSRPNLFTSFLRRQSRPAGIKEPPLPDKI